MPSFAITATATRVALQEGAAAQARFVVRNASARPARAALRAVPTPPASPEWFAVRPGLVSLAPGEAVPVDVTIAPPAGRPSGGYSFRLDAIGEVAPDEDFTEGPSVTFEVPEPETARWRLPALAAAVLALVAAVVLLASRGDDAGAPSERSAPATAPPPEAAPRTDTAPQAGAPQTTTAPEAAPPEARTPDPAESAPGAGPAGPDGADGVPPAGE